LFTSLKNKKFYRYFDCIEKLVKLDMKDLINDEVLLKLNQIYHYTLS